MGTEHFPLSKRVKQKLWRVSAGAERSPKGQGRQPRGLWCHPPALPGAALTEAAAPIVGQHKAWGADALEAARGVGAGAKEADVWLLLTLVDVWGHQGQVTHSRSS